MRRPKDPGNPLMSNAKHQRNKTQNSENSASVKTTWAEAARSTFISAIENDQLIPFAAMLILLIMAVRADLDSMLSILSQLESMRIASLAGWVLFVVTAVALTWIIGQQRKMYEKEIQRISDERSRLQSAHGMGVQGSGFMPLSNGEM